MFAQTRRAIHESPENKSVRDKRAIRESPLRKDIKNKNGRSKPLPPLLK